MIQIIKNLLGIGPKIDLGEMIEKGALIVDVRTKSEYQSGHVKGSVNIPLDQLNQMEKKIKDKEKSIITCCASGMRSGAAKGILRSQGFTNVHNGGSWLKLNQYRS